MNPRQQASLWPIAALAFAAELLLWGLAGYISYLLLSGVSRLLGILAWVLTTALVIYLWSRYMAPKAPRRLSLAYRLAVLNAFGVVLAAPLYWLTGSVTYVVLVVVSSGIIVFGQLILRDWEHP